ncbi:vestigial like 4 like isoform X2 [Hypomesus transpacificus]|uniref:vestigial like 4 like isoform X2 n=1 Tax=Hypomesus transpacificus TaxID=137520 RepID=UPI001F07FA86|nr:vestigial like 4 like isoform X2 [Hypomesus transpacificus]
MAVANFHYLTRMSSGFKVYILEGQPNLRSEDRFRHMTNERVRVPPVHPIKRKHSSDRGLTLEERRERALRRSLSKGAPRPAAGFSIPPSPTSPWSPRAMEPLPSHLYSTPCMDEPLDLIKKPRKEPVRTEEKSKPAPANQIQIRPSVITCVPSVRNTVCRLPLRSSTVVSQASSDHVVDEHFQRSLGPDYQRATSLGPDYKRASTLGPDYQRASTLGPDYQRAPSLGPDYKTASTLGPDYQRAASRQISISVSVDDHFAKALGEKWLQIKSKSSSCSSSTSSPPSSPSVTHSPTYSHSPNQSLKESPSSTTFWSTK